VTSDGSPYPASNVALKSGNLTIIRAAAGELPRIGHRAALQICLLELVDNGGDGADVYERPSVWPCAYRLFPGNELRPNRISHKRSRYGV
jgi:hypothetical protein